MTSRADIRGLRRLAADERGITIIFAMILLLVMLVVGGIVVSYAYSDYQRAQQDLADQRSYQNVESAATFVHGAFADHAAWARSQLRDAQDGDAVDRSLTVTLDADASGSTSDATFADVTVRVKKVASESYDVACFESGAVDASGNLTGVAFHFTVGFDGSTIGTVSSVERVGQ